MRNLDGFLPGECNLLPNVKGNFKNRLCSRQNPFEMTCTDSKYVHGLPTPFAFSVASRYIF